MRYANLLFLCYLSFTPARAQSLADDAPSTVEKTAPSTSQQPVNSHEAAPVNLENKGETEGNKASLENQVEDETDRTKMSAHKELDLLGVQGDWGLNLMVGTGLNICGPRGQASCTDVLPGPYVNGNMEYRFWHLGVGLNFSYGKHFAMGDGSEDVSITSKHLTLDLLGFFPMWHEIEPYVAIGFGYGSIASVDGKQNSSVEWNSLWQTLHLRAGVRGRLPKAWGWHDDWFYTLYSSAYLHQGGNRCVFFAGQGACRVSEELSEDQTDYASTLELGAQLGFAF